MPKKRNKVSKEDAVRDSVSVIEDLLSQADKHIDEFEYDIALGFCQRALGVDPNHVKALETCSSVLLEVGRLKKAKECLVKAVNINPELGYAKYFSLAQLSNGREALNLFKKGIELLKRELELLGDGNLQAGSTSNSGVAEKSRALMRRKLSNAFCSVVELYMTDLCDEEEAERECTVNIEHALASDETNPEAYQCKANFVMVRDNVEDAKQLMIKSLSLWLPKMKEMMNDGGTYEDCPLSYEARLSCAKLLIELQEFESAADVLDFLIVENDENVEVWYLYGLLNYLKEGDEEAKSQAVYYLHKAQQLFEKFGDNGDSEMKNHVTEMLEELGGVAAEADDSEDDKENANNSNEEDEEDICSSEEEMET